MNTNDSAAETTAPHRGLTNAEVEQSRAEFGVNVLTPPRRTPWWRLYLQKFNDPIIRILMIAAFAALAIGLKDGHYVEGVGIIIAILLSTGLSFANEYRAGKEFDILNQTSDGDPVPTVRAGKHTLVPKRELVVGDIVLMDQGAELPADAEVLDAVAFSVNESSLTGESLPVSKTPRGENVPPTGESGHSYPPYMAYRGSTVADGHATLRITAVGDTTEIGKTAKAATETPSTETPLTRQLGRLSRLIGVGAFFAAAVIFIALTVKGVYQGAVMAEAAGQPLSFGQWYAFALLGIVLLILGAQVWLPVLGDARELFGRRRQLRADPPAARKAFLRLVIAAAAVAAVGGGAGIAFGWLDASPEQWLPVPALSAFLGYFMVAVTVIVVAVPEGLPMCVTLALAYSMRKMTAANNLVRKMHACETIGAATVICSDKTGTLTMNEMRVHTAVFPFLDATNPMTSGEQADLLAEAIAANSTANLDHTGETATPIGNPTEAALLLWMHAAERDYEIFRKRFILKQQLPFATERKFMATAGVSAVSGGAVLYMKGASEIVLAHCSSNNGDPLDAAARAAILADAASYQNRGMRILGFAHRSVADDFLAAEIPADVDDLEWDGFFAISDPIRPDVPNAIATAMRAGIRVKVVTGDNQATAREIARQAGLWEESDTDAQIIAGDAFAALADAEAAKIAMEIKVMSRARPLNKLRLVKLLQEQNQVVAVTGDGTNDAPALNHADVGLAMGKTGTSVAKEAADIILLDDSFPSIVNAVSWGRSLYANIQKFIVFQLTINVAAVGIALLGPFLGVSLPLTVAQMLWVNLIMDTFAALALASEPPDRKLMSKPPRNPRAFIISPDMKNAILGVGGFFLLLFLTLIFGFADSFPLIETAPGGLRNLTVFFTAFVALQFWNLFNARAFGTSRSALSELGKSKGFVAMALLIVLGQIALVEFGGQAFRVTRLGIGDWLMIFAVTSPVLWVGEILRWLGRRQDDRSAA